MTVFKYYIVCNFNYCPLICHYCGCINARKQEKIQYRALKFVYNSDDSYETLLQRADLPSINLARIRKIAIEDFKILNQTSPDVLNEMISFRENRRAIIPPPLPDAHLDLDFFLLPMMVQKFGMLYPMTSVCM